MPSTNPEVQRRAQKAYRERHPERISMAAKRRRDLNRKTRISRKGIPQNRKHYGGKPIGIRIVIPDSITDASQRSAYYHAEYTKQNYLLRRAQCLKRAAKYREQNREIMLERTRKWYRNNIEANRARMRDPRARAIKKAWTLKNRDRLNENARGRYAAAEDKQKYFKHRYDRIARQNNCQTDSTADTFYKFVRSRKRIACYYCGSIINGKTAHIDHIIAVSRRGNHSSENLCCSCSECNLRKHTKLPSEITFIDQGLLNL